MEEELPGGFLTLDANGKYPVCIGTFGEDYIKNDKECGVQVNADGTIVLGEYFGGFDGFFSTDPADGHENCFNTAVVDAFGLPKCETEEVEKTVWVRSTVDVDQHCEQHKRITVRCTLISSLNLRGTLCAWQPDRETTNREESGCRFHQWKDVVLISAVEAGPASI